MSPNEAIKLFKDAEAWAILARNHPSDIWTQFAYEEILNVVVSRIKEHKDGRQAAENPEDLAAAGSAPASGDDDGPDGEAGQHQAGGAADGGVQLGR